LVGAPAPTSKPAEIRRKERSNYYLLGAILLGWVVWSQTREKAGVTPASGLTANYNPGGGIVVSWRSGSGVDHYVLKRTTIAGGGTSSPSLWNVQKIDPSTLAYGDIVSDNIPSSQTSFTDPDVQPGSAYFYKLESIGKGGSLISTLFTSKPVIPDAPPAPSNITATRIAKVNYVEVSWVAPAGFNVQTYKIYRGLSQDGPFQLIGNTNQQVYMDTNPPSGNVYYKVASVSSDGAEGLASDPPVLATSEQGPPNPFDEK
jgi:hypothetical protein